MANNFANAINSNIGAVNSGATNTLTVQNPSNTASSQASELITVGGTSSGSCWTQYTVGTSVSYSMGIDTQNSGGTGTRSLVISSTQTGTCSPTSGNVLFSFSSAATSLLTAATFWVPSVAIGGISNPGANSFLNVANASTTAASDASINLQVSAATGGNTHVDYTGPTNWGHGVDKAASNAWKLNTSNSGSFPYSTAVITATTAGDVTLPNNTKFLVVVANNLSNKTGDGTQYTIVYDSEIYDIGSHFSSTTFTAPVTGQYDLGLVVLFFGLGALFTSGNIQLVTSNRTYSLYIGIGAIRDASNQATLFLNTLADMDAADTVTTLLQVSGSTKTVSIGGSGSNTLTYFYGNLEG